MKRKYTKPDIVFESFSMSTSIAAGCEKRVNFAQEVCAVPTSTPFVNVFVETYGSLCDTYPSNDQYDGFCYHIPIESSNFFNS